MIDYPYIHESGKLPATLAGVPFLTSVSSECIDQVLQHTCVVECFNEDVLIEEGESKGAHFFILIRGAVQVIKEGKEIGRIDNPGELIGERALLSEGSGQEGAVGVSRSATVKAVEHSFCIKVDPKFLDDLTESDRQAYYAVLFRFIAGIMAERLSQANHRIAELEKRLAEG